MKSTKKGEKKAEKKAEHAKAEYRAFSMADYRAMEKVAKSIETACRIRRRYVAAMQAATDLIDRNLDKLRAIVWND